MIEAPVQVLRALRGRLHGAMREGVLTAVDLGSFKVSVLIARVQPGLGEAAAARDQSDLYAYLRVVGCGVARADGIEGGVVTDVEKASASIMAAVQMANADARLRAGAAILSFSGGGPRNLLAEGETRLPVAAVDDTAMSRAFLACEPRLAGDTRAALHVEPLGFSIDGGEPIADPRGRSAFSLATSMQVLTAERRAVTDAAAAAREAGLKPIGAASTAHLSALACLTDDEMALGAACIDMGAETTGIAVVRGGLLRNAHLVSIGGNTVSADIATALRISRDEAERMKVSAEGGAAADLTALGPAERGVSKVLVGVIRPRLEECFEAVRASLADLGDPARPVVLTGGASQLPGTVELAARVLGRRCRLGRRVRIGGAPRKASGPGFSAAHGALALAVRTSCHRAGSAIDAAEFENRKVSGILEWLRQNW